MRTALTIAVLASACAARPPEMLSGAAEPRTSERTGDTVPGDDIEPGKAAVHRSLSAVGLDSDALDRTADPCDDFYQFACGGWIKRTEIAADKPQAMRSFIAIEDEILGYAHDMLEQARSRADGDVVARQLGTFYGACMDEAAIDKLGLAPLRPVLAPIDRIRDVHTLTAALAALDAAGLSSLFALAPVQDPADARNVIAGIDQAGLGLPDRDYYLSDDDASRSAIAAYQGYVESVLAMLGHPAAHVEAADVVALETAIARVSRDKVARRDPRASYHKIDRAGVAHAMPHLDWDAYWTAVGLRDVKDVTVTSIELLAGLDKLLVQTRPETWRAYLAFHAADDLAPVLTPQLEDTQFRFTSALTGQPEQSPRWKRCVAHTVTALGDLVGQVFVRDRFGSDSKAAAETEVHAISAAMAADLAGLPWMDDVTRARARAKLDAMTYQIGYPVRWKTYSLRLDRRTFAADALAARRAERSRRIGKIGKPVDRSDWQMDATEVNASYDPQLNGMVFPAGILQPPLYSIAAALPVNFGTIGVMVGHELTHGFDDQGAQYDAAGNLTRWWQPEAEQQFQQRTRCVIDQYDDYEVTGGTRVNGANTVGENIADIAGVKLALAAVHQLRAGASDSIVAEGFTEDQQFFLGFGQAWCAKLRPDFERMLATIDVHAPARWRVDGALAATPEFARAFHCKAGSKMVPKKQCVVW